MIERCAKPAIHAVTLVARHRESRVIEHLRLEILRVAGIAVSRKPHESSGGRLLVTGLAFEHSVCCYQRKSVLVLLYLLNRDMPTLHRVAVLAVRSHLPTM